MEHYSLAKQDSILKSCTKVIAAKRLSGYLLKCKIQKKKPKQTQMKLCNSKYVFFFFLSEHEVWLMAGVATCCSRTASATIWGEVFNPDQFTGHGQYAIVQDRFVAWTRTRDAIGPAATSSKSYKGFPYTHFGCWRTSIPSRKTQIKALTK